MFERGLMCKHERKNMVCISQIMGGSAANIIAVIFAIIIASSFCFILSEIEYERKRKKLFIFAEVGAALASVLFGVFPFLGLSIIC